MAEEDKHTGAEESFTDYGIPPAPVTYFRYLGRVLSADDKTWPAVVRNL